jgi:hypothetical protein
MVLLAMPGCTRYYYMPGSHNVPLMKEAHDVHFSAGAGTGEETQTTELQASYAVTDHVALMGSFMSAEGEEGQNVGFGKYGDFGVGFFSRLREDAVFEMYAGAGNSSQHHSNRVNVFNPVTQREEQREMTADLKFYKTFVQANFGVSYSSFDFGISGRVAQLNFYSVQYDRTLGPGDLNLDRLAVSPHALLFEPAVTLRAGWKYVKLQAQLGLSFQLGKTKHPFESMNAGIGMFFTIAKRFWKK